MTVRPGESLVPLQCTACGVAWLSPAGRSLVSQGERCLRCGGELVVDQQSDENLGLVREA
jgi:hypothetical protein